MACGAHHSVVVIDEPAKSNYIQVFFLIYLVFKIKGKIYIEINRK